MIPPRTAPRFLVAAFLVTASVALPARDALAQDSATAGALFDKGIADMQAGQFASACPAIEESQRLEPRPGTLFTLAECQARSGKVASAVAHYQEYVGLVSRLPPDQQARHRDRVRTANAQVTKLKPQVPTLTLLLPASAPAGTSVTRNGVLLQAVTLGLPLPSDPGDYVIVTRTPAGAERQITLALALGDAKRVPLEVSADSAPTPTTPAAQASAPASAPALGAAANAAPETPIDHPRSKTPAYIAGGIGIAGIAVGSVTGVLVFGKKSTVNGDCSGHVCGASGVSAASSGKSLALVSDIGFGVGIAGLATAAILLLSAPRQEPAPTTALASRKARSRGARWEPLLIGAPGGGWAGVQRTW